MKYSIKPIAVSMGEPSGVASEIIIKTWLKRKKLNLPPFILVDDLQKISQLNELFNLKAKFKAIKVPEEGLSIFNDAIPIVDLKADINLNLGVSDKRNNKYVLKSIKKSFDFVYNKKCSSLLTLPVCKKTLKQERFNFNGQTEFLSYLAKKESGVEQFEIMILSTTKPVDNGKNLVIGLITTHVPLSKVHKDIKKINIIKKILSFQKTLKKIWKINSPKIAITSINPHAGEGGLIGDEEIKIVEPILKKFKTINIRLMGPISADSCFHKKKRESYDGIICFYHDQGLIPVKTLDFNNSINITGGLPFIRVSPDHGPAFDIAKKNIANTESVIAAFNFLKEVVK